MKNERTEMKTLLLCERDAYQTEFKAQVLSFGEDEGRAYAELDQSAFFPEGGGQAADEGVLAGFKVIDVQRKDGRVLHYLALSAEDKERAHKTFTPGCEVEGEVDYNLRFLRMQNHLAEHLFCGIAHRRFGLDNVGFHLTDIVTFDLSGPLTKEEIADIERKCNEAVWANVPIRVHFPTAGELGSYAFRSKLELEDGIRLVEIEGYDLCACCAPALHSSGEIGPIKVISHMPHRGGVRITLIAGKSAYEDYALLARETEDLMKTFSARRELVSEYAAEYVRKATAEHELNTALRKEIAALTAEKVKEITKSGRERICFFLKDGDEVQVRNIINTCVKEYDGIICGFRGNDREGYRYVCGRREADKDDSLRTLAVELKQAFGGSGGGSKVMIQGMVPAKEKEILKFYGEESE